MVVFLNRVQFARGIIGSTAFVAVCVTVFFVLINIMSLVLFWAIDKQGGP
jgi:hypothetical protein